MHIENFDEKLIIYINKKINLEDISTILLKSKILGLDIKKYDNIVIYEDEILGTILELTLENDNYFTSIDMNISVSTEKGFLLKLEENYIHNLKSIILRWMNNGDCKPSYINSFFLSYNRYIFCYLFTIY